MADSTPPPPPPAPGQGAADAPLEPAKKPTTRRTAAATPAAGAPAAPKKPAAAKAAATSKPAAAQPAPAPIEAPAATRPDPYAASSASPSATPGGPALPPAPAATTPYSALPTPPPTTLSVLALVFGVMGLVFSFIAFGLLPAIAGVILGHLALKREPHARGMAIAGLACGYAGIAISLLWGVLFVGLTILPLLFFSSFGMMGGF